MSQRGTLLAHMGWSIGLDRIAVALEGCQVQLARIADRLGAQPAAHPLVVEVRDPDHLILPLDGPLDPQIAYRDPELLLKAQDAEETLTLLLGRPPSEDELSRVLAMDTES